MRTCETCGEVFTSLVPARRECTECWLAHDDRDDMYERCKARARLLVAVLKANRDEP